MSEEQEAGEARGGQATGAPTMFERPAASPGAARPARAAPSSPAPRRRADGSAVPPPRSAAARAARRRTRSGSRAVVAHERVAAGGASSAMTSNATSRSRSVNDAVRFEHRPEVRGDRRPLAEKEKERAIDEHASEGQRRARADRCRTPSPRRRSGRACRSAAQAASTTPFGRQRSADGGATARDRGRARRPRGRPAVASAISPAASASARKSGLSTTPARQPSCLRAYEAEQAEDAEDRSRSPRCGSPGRRPAPRARRRPRRAAPRGRRPRSGRGCADRAAPPPTTSARQPQQAVQVHQRGTVRPQQIVELHGEDREVAQARVPQVGRRPPRHPALVHRQLGLGRIAVEEDEEAESPARRSRAVACDGSGRRAGSRSRGRVGEGRRRGRRPPRGRSGARAHARGESRHRWRSFLRSLAGDRERSAFSPPQARSRHGALLDGSCDPRSTAVPMRDP